MSNDTKQPFFIIGSGRCGSTLLYDILSQHSKIALTNEGRVTDLLYLFSCLASLPAFERREVTLWADWQLTGIVEAQCTKTLSPIVDRHAKDILTEFYSAHFEDKDFTHWGDKLPDPELAHLVRGIFPATRYILLVRDPRDVYCSWLGYKRRTEEQGRKLGSEPHALPDLARYWKHLHDGCLERLPDAHLVIYERLLAETDEVTNGILAFLGLEPASHDGESVHAKRFVKHGSSESPEASLQRWRRELDAGEVKVIEDACGELMVRFGYELSS